MSDVRASIGRLDDAIARLEGLLSAQGAALSEAQARIAALEEALAEREGELTAEAGLRAEAAEALDAAIAELKTMPEE